MEGKKILVGVGVIIAVILIARRLNYKPTDPNIRLDMENNSNASGCGCGK